MRLGIIAGSVIAKEAFNEKNHINTKWGRSSSGTMTMNLGRNECIFLARHGNPPNIPPHRINHRANVKVLEGLNADAVISICSTGALRPDIKVPGFAIPSDYIDLFSNQTYHDNDIYHATPGLDEDIQKRLTDACRSLDIDPLIDCTYVQTRGPRLETRAEVSLISRWGDVVGMNMGPEAALCSELEIRSGALLTVDNYANGIGDKKPDFNEILTSARSNWDTILEILSHLPEKF
jgi:5'-methylthioadenosine phosphorylase